MSNKHVTYPALSIFVLSTLCSAIVQANETTVSSQEDSITLQNVVVTGSRRAVSSPLQSPAPVDVLSQTTLAATGATDLSRALTSLSPSFSLPSSPGGSFASSIPAGAALRGLSADQTLILINGKRRHIGANFTRQAFNGGRGSAVTDLSLIPISAISRVEILRDGAAAQYGSDAIAGVINIILKNDDHGGGLSYQYGEYKRGDGEQNKITGWTGVSLPNDGSLTIAFDVGSQGYANNTNPDTRVFYPASTANAAQKEASSPYRNWRFGTPKVKDQFNLLLNLDQPVTEAASIYGVATYGQRLSIGQNFYEPPTTAAVLNQSAFFKQRYPDGRVPENYYDLTDGALTLGFKTGTQQQGKLDIYANYGRNKVSSEDHNGINPSYGADSASTYFTGERISSQSNLGIDYSRDLNTHWFYSPLTLSAGLAYRREQYELVAGDKIAWTRGPFYNASQTAGVGIPGIFSGITGEDQRKIDRHVNGVYIDLETDVVKDLNVGLAARAEDYSDFGGTTNGKLSAKYNLSPQFTLRGTASTGYRAPSIVQLGYSAFSVQTQQINGAWQDVQQRTLLPGSEVALRLGGKALEPEQAKNYSLGLVWKPLPQASATVDVYQIDIDKRILLSDNITGSLVTNALAGTAYSSIGNVAFFNNLLDTKTKGYEITGKYNFDLNQYGKLNLGLGFSANDTKITQVRNANTAASQVIPSALIAGRNTRSLIEEATPKNKLILSTNWQLQNWELTAATRRYAEWTTRDTTNPTLDQTFGAQWIADIDVGYKADQFIKGLKFNIGAINAFDSYPDRSISTGVGGVTKYSFNSPEGFYGAFYYGRLSYRF